MGPKRTIANGRPRSILFLRDLDRLPWRGCVMELWSLFSYHLAHYAGTPITGYPRVCWPLHSLRTPPTRSVSMLMHG